MNVKENDKDVKEIGKYFSNISQAFIEDFEKNGLKKHTRPIIEYFNQIELKTLSVLELGCGIGGLLIKFLELGVEQTFGVDLSDKMIEHAKIIAASKKFEDKTEFFIGDFNSVSVDILPISHADIVIADRVLCCSPVPLKILNNMIEFNPEYLVIVQPRKNYLYRIYMSIRIRYRQFKWGVKNHGAKIPYIPIREYDKVCLEAGYDRQLQEFYFEWEIVIYKKKKRSTKNHLNNILNN